MGAEHEPVFRARVVRAIDVVGVGWIDLLGHPESAKSVTSEHALQRIRARAQDFGGIDVPRRPTATEANQHVKQTGVARDLRLVEPANSIVIVRRAYRQVEIFASCNRPSSKVGIHAVRRFEGTRAVMDGVVGIGIARAVEPWADKAVRMIDPDAIVF
jgi:hypothetical protein